MTNDSILKITEVQKQFSAKKPPALTHINADIFPGRVTGLIGPDGAGKTTLMRLLTGLMSPSSGHITWNGIDISGLGPKYQEEMGYMPQKFGLYEDLTVKENLTLYADLRGVPMGDRQELFGRLLKFTDLNRFQKRRAGALSGGMKQKLGLACTLLSKPKILLLDEPSVGVDPISRRELWRMVQELLGEGMAVVWSTAYLDEAERCDHIILLNKGQLLFTGKPAELTERIADRTFVVKSQGQRPRRLLSQLLQSEPVMDGIMKGRYPRILLRAKLPSPPVEALNLSDPIILEPTQPRFEDGFMDILGGGPGGDSALANHMTQRPKSEEAIITAKELTKKFGNFTAADRISFEVHRGEIFGLLGPNGAGKSTTFKMMCGLLRPTFGTGTVAGIDLRTSASKARARIGYMAQKFSLYGMLSVLQNLRFFSGVYGLHGRNQEEAIERSIEIFELRPFLSDSADQIPLGIKQRLALSCAVMHEPEALFLDEPTSGVDPITRREFWNHINGMVEKGVTVMVTTHFMDEAEYCDRIGLVYRGQLMAQGSPTELKQQVQGTSNDPSLEDAFIALIQNYEKTGTEEAEVAI